MRLWGRLSPKKARKIDLKECCRWIQDYCWENRKNIDSQLARPLTDDDFDKMLVADWQYRGFDEAYGSFRFDCDFLDNGFRVYVEVDEKGEPTEVNMEGVNVG